MQNDAAFASQLADLERLLPTLSGTAFAPLAKDHRGGLVSSPMRIGDNIIGVINLSEPAGRRELGEDHLESLTLYAEVIGKSVHIMQLEKVLKSRFLQMAAMTEAGRSDPDPRHMVSPNPDKLAKLVAKTIFHELSAAGFNANEIINVTSEVITLLQQQLLRHKKRREREHKA